jgi:hypothetical protein
MNKKTISLLIALIIIFPVIYLYAQLTDDTPSTSDGQIFCPALTTTFKKGSKDLNTNGQVSDLQTFLVDYYNLTSSQLVVTGFFGSVTFNYLKQFQTENNIPAFGIVGSLTRAKISTACSGSSIQTCTPDPLSPKTRTIACPTGQTGSIIQTSISTCQNSSTTPVWSDWTDTSNTCVNISSTQSCTLGSEIVSHGNTAVKYQNPSVTSPETCQSETRTCNNGVISGSYTNNSCTVMQPQASMQNRLITNLHRYVPGAMFGGWGPHLGHMLRDGFDNLWFTDDTGSDINKNSGLNYYKFNTQNNTWSLAYANALYGRVQQNTASIINSANVIMTYGVDLENSKLEECYLVTYTGQKACNLIINIPLGVNPNYIGAAISPNGQTRLVWWTNQIDGAGKFNYIYNSNYTGWNGPFTSSLNGYNDLGYVNTQFTSENNFKMLGQVITGSSPDWKYYSVLAEASLGTPLSISNTITNTGNIIQSTPNDFYVDVYGGKHVLLKPIPYTTNNVYYVYVSPSNSFSQPISLGDAAYSRFAITNDKINVVLAKNTGGIKILSKLISSINGEINWSNAETQTQLTEFFDGIYTESKNYQTKAVTKVNVGLNPSARQTEVIQLTQ